ncbi:electron transfer flavoprotein-ubiquinone oxidoreductase [Coxiella burnetii]|uniref:electron transfer flavoprotein-ubiquinone oxidoreductase n=1 Tax=Coxiella burnetii TaxID=777 RepID=UPI000163A2B0|nr:electron transfer flavoprotein-ubiquinone oxidoreductase [Coxiella burnetii]ATN85850.1 electron transfer flavoprotein-ubiquinone oxidoreductase [Coxiella burnetii str. Schperling]EDR35548.1 electron-transferring-flavoprotein dehydrogenase [Coxiella burnetii Q321]PHH56468.1 electron transfer flavoprotein-ubiquinone oxidoreductase [Coxiella burnetii]
MEKTFQRESLEFDVLIVGAGPAGLSAAIRLAQENRSLSIAVLEKGASVGAHILSGAILEPRALNELIPDWSKRNAPVHVAVQEDQFYLLTAKKSFRLPTPITMRNSVNYIISLGRFCQWLGEQAESFGVNVFPGFAAAKVLFDPNGAVIGVQTGDMGLDKEGRPTDSYQPGLNLYAKQTLFAEGCRGSLTEELIRHFNLRKNSDPQTYGIGIKELWKISPEKYKKGLVVHTVGWPLDSKTYGGSFVYHYENNLLAIGLVVGLDYQNPYLDPFKEFQRFKTHPLIRHLLEDGECIGYGARALNEGGFQSIPTLTFPGGMLIGCSAGFLNVGKIKGSHTAMKSGMLAAETLLQTKTLEPAQELKNYSTALKRSWVYKELNRVRNLRPAFRKGLWAGLLYSAFDQFILRGKAPWTFHHQPDYRALKPAKICRKIAYSKPDGKLTFDKLTQVYLTGTQHRENEPCHLWVKNQKVETDITIPVYAAPEQRYCPANVYEIIEKNGKPCLHINASNCIHCKTCDIKDPSQNIRWVVPEGGDGPNYSNL